MTQAEINLLTPAIVGVVIGLLTALQAWLVNKARVHTNQLDGVLTGRIQTGAQVAIAADHVARGNAPTVTVDPVAVARIAALQAELADLQAGKPLPS